ncbi:MAG: site-specific integrase [Solirubrobacteraceae bacterium]
MAEGVCVRIGKDGSPSYRASVWHAGDQRKVRKSLPTLAAAKAWRADTIAGIKAGRIRASQPPRLEDIFGRVVDGRWEDGVWIDGALAGVIRTRGRRPFKESSVRAVRQHYQRRLAEPFGRTRLDQVSLPDLQEFVDALEMQGLSPSTIEGTVLPLRLAYRWARSKGLIAVDPTDGLELPGKLVGTRVPPSPQSAAALLAALAPGDQALWATAMLAGLRRGELLGLRWEDIDLEGGILSVERSWNPDGGVYSTPKSRNGRRKVPIGASLAQYFRTHMLATGRREGLVFGQTARKPQRPEALQSRADTAWSNANAVAAAWATGRGEQEPLPLERVTLHACRHLYASMSIAAGVNAHALCKYMGHSGIQVTYDLYGHLFPGNEAEASALLDRYLERSFLAVADC